MEDLAKKQNYIGPSDDLEMIQSTLSHIMWNYPASDNLDYVFGNRYGKPTRETKTKKTWKCPKWTVSIARTTKTMTLTWEPKCDDLETAYDLAQEFRLEIGVSGTQKLLSGREEAALLRVGFESMADHQLKLYPMSQDELKKFVLRYMEGLIFTDRHCSGSSPGMVFMPLMFGALEIPKDVMALIEDKLPPEPDEEPKLPERPAVPAYPQKPDKPTIPPEIKADPAILEDLVSQVGFQQATKEKIEIYTADIKAQNDKQDGEFLDKLNDWMDQCEKIDAQIKELKANLAEDRKQYDIENQDFDKIVADWDLASLKRNLAWKGVVTGHNVNLGIVWEDYSEAGPRSVNGLPCFMSCKFMSKSDWKRACTAIEKEQKRRDRMTL